LDVTPHPATTRRQRAGLAVFAPTKDFHGFQAPPDGAPPQFPLAQAAALTLALASLTTWAATPAPAQRPAHLRPAQPGPVTAPLWMRAPAISPDGRSIAFAFQGNLFTVPAAGGTAHLLVANGQYSSHPVWSPDGRSIAFSSRLYGNDDVFLVSAEGGPARRLTTHSANETPVGFTPDGQSVLFSAARMDAKDNLMFPSGGASELYQVSVEGGRPRAAAQHPGPGRADEPRRHRDAVRGLEGLREPLPQAPHLAGGARHLALRREDRPAPPADHLRWRGP
jgi:dipeptidyl aminopeptidase/acylaminoacyl peptidase